MTSSLVGSEMCIRDRQCTTSHKKTDGGLLQRDSSAEQQLPHDPHKEGAVSYTHLTLPTICSV
eukprot:10414271-Prorocentrum_lima.AAC.1